MRICGFAAEGLRNERHIHETFPVKELQDYWSSHPKYEDVNPKSKEFRSGSLLSDKVGEEDPDGGGQTYQEWLALQREEKEDVPPPPYTLEGVESTSPISAENNVTNANIRSSTVATTAEVPVQNSPAVANVQPPVSSSQTAARPAVNINTYPASSSHAVPTSNIPAATPPAVNMNTYPASHAASPPAVNINAYPTSTAPVSRQEAYSQVSAQSPQPSYPPAQGHSSGSVHPQSVAPSQGHSPYPPPGVSQHPQSHLPSQSHSPQPSYPPAQGHSPQSVPPSQGHSSKPYPPDVSQYPQSNLPSHLNSPHATSARPVQSYPPHTGQQHQPYQTQNFQPYPPTSGQVPVWGQQPQPYPPGGPSSQGYPNSGGPVHQGYPPVDVQGHPSNQSYNQPQDSVNTLANEFGRQSISNPSGVSSDGRLPPPPLHPSRRPSSSSLKPSSPLSSGGGLPPPPLHPEHPGRLPSSSLKPSTPSNFPSRPQSQTGHHHAAASTPVSSSPGQVTSTPATSTKPHRWPPAEWDSDTPPVPQFSLSGRRPSAHGHVGATLIRPQTAGASSSNLSGGSTLRPTSSLSSRPSRPDTNMPSAHTHGHSDNNTNPISFPTGPAKYEQYMTFPSGPLYNSSYAPSGYPDPQGSIAWPGSGHVSPPPPTFPLSSMAYGTPASSYGSGIESQYPGGPTFPSTTSSGSGAGGERLDFPEGPNSSYFDASSSYPAPWASTSGPPMQSRK